MSGGVRETDVKADAVNPAGNPSAHAVTIVTPVAKCARASRKAASEIASGMVAAPLRRRGEARLEMGVQGQIEATVDEHRGGRRVALPERELSEDVKVRAQRDAQR